MALRASPEGPAHFARSTRAGSMSSDGVGHPMHPARPAVLAAAAALLVSAVGFGVATAQGLGCEFDCLGAFENPHVARLVQGTPYSAPAPFLVVVAVAAVLASRPRRGVALSGLALVGVLGAVMGAATLGEPWAQRALAAPDAMLLALMALLAPALGMLVFGARGAWRRARSA